jgi:hypothetical protein
MFIDRWDGMNPDIKVPMYRLPQMRNVPSKIGSLENLKHLPGKHSETY